MREAGAILFVFFSFSSFAQLANIQGAGNNVIRSNKYAGVEGTPYLHADWLPGSLVDNEGAVFANLFLRYDAHRGILEMNKTGNVVLVDKTVHPSFTLSLLTDAGVTETEIFRNGYGNIPNLTKNDYLQVLLDEKILLLKYVKISLEEENATSYGGQAASKKFVKKELYFLKMAEDEMFKEVKISKKSLSSVLPQYSQLLKSDMKNKRLKSEEDLIVLLKYFSLQ